MAASPGHGRLPLIAALTTRGPRLSAPIEPDPSDPSDQAEGGWEFLSSDASSERTMLGKKGSGSGSAGALNEGVSDLVESVRPSANPPGAVLRRPPSHDGTIAPEPIRKGSDRAKDTRTPLGFTAVAEHAADIDLGSPALHAFVQLLAEGDVVIDPTLGVFKSMFVARPGSRRADATDALAVRR